MSQGNRLSGRLSLLEDGLRCLGGGLLPEPDPDLYRSVLAKLNAPLLWEGDQA